MLSSTTVAHSDQILTGVVCFLSKFLVKNREEWELRGEDVVKEMAEECRKKYGVKAPDGSIRINGEPVVEAPPESAPRVTTKSLLDTFLDVETEVEV